THRHTLYRPGHTTGHRHRDRSPPAPRQGETMAYTEQEVLAGLAEIVAEETGLPIDAVALEKSFTDDLDIDSLSMMTIVTHADATLRVPFPHDAVKNLTTDGDAVSFIPGAQDGALPACPAGLRAGRRHPRRPARPPSPRPTRGAPCPPPLTSSSPVS